MFKWQNKDPVSFQLWQKIKRNQLLTKYKIHFINVCKNKKSKQLCTWPVRDIDVGAINTLKLVAQKYIQPQKNKKCALILLTNIAEPEWISIDCLDQIIGDILCMVPRNVEVLGNVTKKSTLVVFKNPCILINGKCYFFSWGFQNDKLRHQNLIMTSSTRIAMEHLVTAINGEFPPFHGQFTLTIYCKITNKWTFQKVKERYKGFHIAFLLGSSYIDYGNVYECQRGIFVAYVFVCDGKKDCPGDVALDEMSCFCEENGVTLNKSCKYVLSKDGTKTCSIFYLTLKDGSCMLYAQENRKNINLTHQKFNFVGSLKSISNFDSKLTCQNNGQLSCRDGYTNCYNITEICTYRLDENNFLYPCKGGEHTENCREIQCNMKFKCPEFYCIPWSYVCDGKWDCPDGYDEVKELGCGVNRHCKNMFKCRNSQKCIHVSDVCNSLVDCPSSDDEYMCSLNGAVCISSCVCLGSAVKCYNVSSEKDFLTSIPAYNVLFLSNCNLAFLEYLLKILIPPTVLSLTYNNVRHVCELLPALHQMLVIDLGFNQIEHVNQDCFKKWFSDNFSEIKQ